MKQMGLIQCSALKNSYELLFVKNEKNQSIHFWITQLVNFSANTLSILEQEYQNLMTDLAITINSYMRNEYIGAGLPQPYMFGRR